MNRVFEAREYFRVPDGTDVSPFLNGHSASSGLAADVLPGVSIAAGRIAARSHSAVHVHPIVTEVTYLLAGRLVIRMKDPGGDPYDCALVPGQAVITRPGTWFQLRNDDDRVAEVLYIVTPPYVFAPGHPPYDDALVIGATWDEARDAPYDLDEVRKCRAAVLGEPAPART